MKMIEVKTSKGVSILLNADLITTVVPIDDENVNVYLADTGEYPMQVNMSFKEFKRQLKSI